jgi:hypothetical protein
MNMNTTIHTEGQVEEKGQEGAEITLLVLDAAEMIHVGGGYIAADY